MTLRFLAALILIFPLLSRADETKPKRPTYLSPGVYVEEVPGGARPIEAVGTSTAAFLGKAPLVDAMVNELVWVNNWTEFCNKFVFEADKKAEPSAGSTPLSHAVFGFFQNGGGRCCVINLGSSGSLSGEGGKRAGLDLLEETKEVSIVAAPGYTEPAHYDAILSHCEKMGDRFAILDGPAKVDSIDSLTKVGVAGDVTGGLRPRNSDDGYGAFYFPQIVVQDPLEPVHDDPSVKGREVPKLVTVPPSGHLAGIYARTDAARGVHKAPANMQIRGALDLTQQITGDEQGRLNPFGVNCLRFFPGEGFLVFGARTLAPVDSEWRFINTRRLVTMIEESIARSTRWAVFEPNEAALWKSLRRDVTAFLTMLWRSGGLIGATPEEAFFVKCDEETNPPEVRKDGRVVILIGVAPVKPAEFTIFQISQSVAESGVEK